MTLLPGNLIFFLRHIRAKLKFVPVPFVYLLVALIVTFPLILNLNKGFMYYPLSPIDKDSAFNDGGYYIWLFWWFKKAIFELHTNPFYTNYIFYPHGTSLIANDGLLNILVSLSLQVFFSAVATYNVIIILNLVVVGCCAYLFAKHFLKSRLLGFYAGLYVTSSTFMIMRSLAHINLQNPGPAFLFLLSFIKFSESKSPRFLASSVVLLLLTTLSSFYYLSMTLIIIYLYLFFYCINNKKSLMPAIKENLLFTVVPTVILMLGFIIVVQKHYLLPLDPLGTSIPWSNDLIGFLSPPHLNLLYRVPSYFLSRLIVVYGSTPFEKNNFVGLAALIALLLFVRDYRGGNKKLIISIVLASYVLSLGPFLTVLGKVLPLPLPYWFLYLLNPFFIFFLRAPARFSIFVVLFLSIPIGYLSQRLSEKFSNRLARFLALLVLGLFIVAEGVMYPISTYSVYSNPFYTDLQGKKDKQILDLPITYLVSPVYQRYLIDQTLHGQKIINGFLPSVNPLAEKYYPSIRYADLNCSVDNNGTPEPYLLYDKLRNDRVSYIVFHKELISHKELTCNKVESLYESLRVKYNKIYEDNIIEVLWTQY